MKNKAITPHPFLTIVVAALLVFQFLICRAVAVSAVDDSSPMEMQENYIEAHPEDAAALLQLGISYMKLGRHVEAIAQIEESIKNDSEEPFAYAWLARANAEIGVADKARELADKASELAPDDRILNEFVGGVMYELGDYKAAEEIAFSLAGEEYFYSTKDGSEILLLLLSRLQLNDDDGVNELVEKVSVVEKEDSDCMKSLLADALIGTGEAKWRGAAMKLLNSKGPACETCGAMDFRKGYAACLGGDYAAAEKSFMDAVTAQCDGTASYRGHKEGELQAILAARRGGAGTRELLDWLDGLQGVDGSPYYYWTRGLLLLESKDEKAAAEAYLESAKLLPVNFGAGSGAYSLFAEDDRKALYDLEDLAGQDMETFAISCGHDLPVPIGTFFTSTKKPGIENLFRYSGRNESGECGFDIFRNDTVKIDEELIDGRLVMPVSFSEDYYFIKNVYPSERFFQVAWYAQIAELFPGLAPPSE